MLIRTWHHSFVELRGGGHNIDRGVVENMTGEVVALCVAKSGIQFKLCTSRGFIKHTSVLGRGYRGHESERLELSYRGGRVIGASRRSGARDGALSATVPAQHGKMYFKKIESYQRFY